MKADTRNFKTIHTNIHGLPFFAKIGVSLGILLTIFLSLHAIYHMIYGTQISLLTNEQPVFTGINGYGTIQKDFHPEKDAIKKLTQTFTTNKKSGKDTSSLKKLTESITCSFSQQKNLSNGMVIQYACTYDTKIAQKENYHFSDVSKSYTVNSLQKPKVLDPFENLKTQWNSDSDVPQLQLIPDQIAKELSIQYQYTYSSQTTAHVTVSYDEETLMKNGWIIQNSQQEITFEKPVTSFKDTTIHPDWILTDSFMEYLQQDLSQCSTYSFGKEWITADNPALLSIKKTDAQIEVTFSLQNLYTSLYPGTYHFSVSYEGVLYEDENGQMIFLTNTSHACRYEGFSQNYTIEKDVPS